MARSETSVRSQNTFLVPLAVFFVLASIYLLTFSGLFRSIDELTMYSMAESAVQGGSWPPSQLLFTPYHNPIAGFELLQPILAALIYMPVHLLSGLGNIQAVMFLNIAVTAATGTIVCIILLRLNHGLAPAAGASLAFGLATLAWPYSRSFFREPGAGLLLVLALLGLIRFRQTGHRQWSVFCFSAYALSVALKLESLVLLLPILVTLYAAAPRAQRTGLLRLLLVGLIPVALVAAVNFELRTVARGVWQSRDVSHLQADPVHWLEAFYGLTLSPGKGLVFYSPILVPGFLGLVVMARRGLAGKAMLAVVASYLTSYALLQNWGGDAWGPRYLVPLSPLLAIPLAEVWSRGRRWQIAMGTLAVVSVAIQLVASTAHWGVYYARLVSRHPEPEATLLMDPGQWRLSPVIGQFATWGPENFDLLWWRPQVPGESADPQWALLAIPLGLLAISLGYLFYLWKPMTRPSLRTATALVAIALVLGTGAFVGRAYAVEASYPRIDTPSLRSIAETINQASPRRHLVISLSHDFHHNVFMNYLKGSYDHFWFSPLQEDGFEILLPAMREADRIFLVTDRQPPGTALETWLNGRAYRYDAGWVGPYLLFRHLPPSALAPHIETGALWEDGIELVSFASDRAVARTGTPIRLEFLFRAYGEVKNDYDLFVHLTSLAGEVVAGIDGPPQFGARPTSHWRQGKAVIDRRALTIPATLNPGTYTIEVGFYQGDTRLQLMDGPLPDRVRLAYIEVEA